MDAIVKALSDGSVDNLMKVEYDSANVQSTTGTPVQGQQAQPQAVSPALVQTPVAPVVQPAPQPTQTVAPAPQTVSQPAPVAEVEELDEL